MHQFKVTIVFLILGTSAASERTFSHSGKVIGNDRCSLKGETIEMLMMEKCRLAPITEKLKLEMNKLMGRKQVRV